MGLIEWACRLFFSESREDQAAEREEYGGPAPRDAESERTKLQSRYVAGEGEADDPDAELRKPPDPNP